MTLFTFAAVFATPLAIVQLAVIWGTWFALKRYGSKTYEISQLRQRLDDALADLPDDVAAHASNLLSNTGQYRVTR